MTSTMKDKSEEELYGKDAAEHFEEVKNQAQWAIKALGLRMISDEELDKELDKLLSEYPAKDTPFGKLMGEARRRFLYKKDLDVVAAALKKKIMCDKWGRGCGISSLFF